MKTNRELTRIDTNKYYQPVWTESAGPVDQRISCHRPFYDPWRLAKQALIAEAELTPKPD